MAYGRHDTWHDISAAMSTSPSGAGATEAGAAGAACACVAGGGHRQRLRSATTFRPSILPAPARRRQSRKRQAGAGADGRPWWFWSWNGPASVRAAALRLSRMTGMTGIAGRADVGRASDPRQVRRTLVRHSVSPEEEIGGVATDAGNGAVARADVRSGARHPLEAAMRVVQASRGSIGLGRVDAVRVGLLSNDSISTKAGAAAIPWKRGRRVRPAGQARRRRTSWAHDPDSRHHANCGGSPGARRDWRVGD